MTGNGERDTDVLIVGGGVVGLATAYYLLERGMGVRIVDQGAIGNGSSQGNCGLVTPSHIPPLAVPGMMVKAVRWMFDSGSPFYIKPTLRPSVLKWFLNFAGRCQPRYVVQAAAGRAALLNSSRDLYDTLISRHRLQCEWEPRGLLMVYRTEAGMRSQEPFRELMAGYGITYTHLHGEQLERTEPSLRSGLYGAHFYEMDAHLRPDRLIKELERLVREKGAKIEEEGKVVGFVSGGNGMNAVETPRGRFGARSFVLATGAWTPGLAREMGLDVPIVPGKGYTLTMERPPICPRYPMILKERSIAVTPWPSGYRLGGTMEFSGYSEGVNRKRVRAIVRGAAEYLKEPVSNGDWEEWYGWRPMTYDDLPFIARAPRISNLLVAAGHGMMGMSMAPATGKLITELIAGAPPHIDPAPYRLDR